MQMQFHSVFIIILQILQTPASKVHSLTNTSKCEATTMEINDHSWILILIDWSVNSDWNFSNNVIIRLKDKIMRMYVVLCIVTYQISFIPKNNETRMKTGIEKAKRQNQTNIQFFRTPLTAKEVSSFKFLHIFLVWKKIFYHVCLGWDRLLWVEGGGWGCPVPGYSQWKFFYSIYLSEIFSSRRWSNQYRYSTGENV